MKAASPAGAVRRTGRRKGTCNGEGCVTLSRRLLAPVSALLLFSVLALAGCSGSSFLLGHDDNDSGPVDHGDHGAGPLP